MALCYSHWWEAEQQALCCDPLPSYSLSFEELLAIESDVILNPEFLGESGS